MPHVTPGAEDKLAAATLLADADFAFLHQAFVAAHMEPALQPLLRDCLGEPVTVQIRGVRVVRHKPGRRCLIEYDVWVQRSGCLPEAMPLLGKVRAQALDERSYRAQKHLWRSGFDADSADGISVPEPVGSLPNLRMWLQRRVGGAPAWPPVAGAAQRDLARRVTDAVHKLHCSSVLPERVHGAGDELSILYERLGALARLRPALAERIDRVLDGCARVVASLVSRTTCGIHRDFYPDQLLVDGDRIYLLDLDLLCAGDPALDYGNYIGHLVERSLRLTGRADAFAEAQAELEERFAQAWRLPGGRSAVRSYATLTLARHVYISTRIAERQPFTELILSACEERLEAASLTP